MSPWRWAWIVSSQRAGDIWEMLYLRPICAASDDHFRKASSQSAWLVGMTTPISGTFSPACGQVSRGVVSFTHCGSLK